MIPAPALRFTLIPKCDTILAKGGQMLQIKNQKRGPFIPKLSLSALLDVSCFLHRNDIVANEKELVFTRRELLRDRLALAKTFLKLGIKSGDIITVATSRSMYDNIVVFFAANRIGAVVAFLDEKTPRETLLHYLDEFKSPLLITRKWTDERIKRLKDEKKSVKHVMNFTSDFNERNFNRTILETFRIGRTNAEKYAEIFEGKVPRNIFKAKSEALISFTSGSTSGPKPMVFTNENIIAAILYSKGVSGAKMWDKKLHSWMSYVKFDCPYGLVLSALAPIVGGGELVLTPDVNIENLKYYLNKNPNTIFGVPLLLELLPEVIDEKTDISGLKMFVSGGERLEKEISLGISEFFKSRGLKVKVCNGYGVGETLGTISTSIGDAAYNPNSVGKIPAGVHVMVLDSETGEELGFNKTGILYVTGKHILKRYHNRPELDEEKIVEKDGVRFVKTGDLAYVTETGYIILVGRATFFINNLPAKVYYEVVRTATVKSELIEKCYVVKGPSEKYKFASYAFVVPKEGVGKNDKTRRKIMKTASEPFSLGRRRIVLKEYELPEKIIFLDDFPHTRAEKIDFRKLEEMAREMGKNDEK